MNTVGLRTKWDKTKWGKRFNVLPIGKISCGGVDIHEKGVRKRWSGARTRIDGEMILSSSKTGLQLPTPAAAGTTMPLTLAAREGTELHHIGMEEAPVQAAVGKKNYVESAEESSSFSVVVRILVFVARTDSSSSGVRFQPDDRRS